MGKQLYKPSQKSLQVLEDLDKFRNFVVDYGYRFNESDLYNFKSYAWQQYNKFIQGKNAKDMWEIDAKRFSGRR